MAADNTSLMAVSGDDEPAAVTRFRQYLRIRTVQPKPDYQTCSLFLVEQAANLQLEYRLETCVPGKPIVIMTWSGRDPSLSSILLNSHTDVVPVFESKWTSDPFAAIKRPNGDIVARGAQDMKCVGMAYLEAIRRLKARHWSPLRTFHVHFVPDEEIGGHDGMQKWVQTDGFRQLRAGFALDEGLANPGSGYKVYYGVRIRATGAVGHGSQFIANTAAIKLHKIIAKLLAFRDSEELRLKTGRGLTLGDVTTVNLTLLRGGVQFNVVPDTMEAGFDIRVSPTMNLSAFRDTLQSWCDEAGCVMEFEQYFGSNPTTPLTDKNCWWQAIQAASTEMKTPLHPEIFPAATDSRYLREAGIPAIGVSPMDQTPVLLHDHDEFLNQETYLKGIAWYETVLERLGSVTREAEQASGTLLV